MGLARSIVEKELGVNNPLRRLAPSRCRGMIWRKQALGVSLVAAYPAWQVCLVQRTKYAASAQGFVEQKESNL